MGTDHPVDARRFRMLFEIDGVDAHGEDESIGRHIQVGGTEFAITGDIGRCIVTSASTRSARVPAER
jgi:uncharacterized protein YcbX